MGKCADVSVHESVCMCVTMHVRKCAFEILLKVVVWLLSLENYIVCYY